jgi:hypothetical protein
LIYINDPIVFWSAFRRAVASNRIAFAHINVTRVPKSRRDQPRHPNGVLALAQNE